VTLPSKLMITLAGLLFVVPVYSATLLVGNKSAASVNLIDLDSGETVATTETREGPHEIAVSGDGKLAVVTNYGTGANPGNSLTVIEVEKGKAVGTIDLGEYSRPHGIVFMPDSRHVLVTAEGAKSLVKVDVYLGKVVKAVPTGQSTSHMLAYDPSGMRAYVSNMGSASVSLIDVRHGELLSFESSGSGAEGIALGKNGLDLWVTNRGEDTVSLFDARYLRLLGKIDVGGFPIRAEVTPDGSRVLVSSARSGTLSVIDVAKRELVQQENLGLQLQGADKSLFGGQFGKSSIPIGIEIAPDGQRVWIAHAGIDRVQELDGESLKQTRIFSTGPEPDAMAYSPLKVKP